MLQLWDMKEDEMYQYVSVSAIFLAVYMTGFASKMHQTHPNNIPDLIQQVTFNTWNGLGAH